MSGLLKSYDGATEIAKEHVRWMSQAGFSPREIIASVRRKWNRLPPDWDDAERTVAYCWVDLANGVKRRAS